MRTEGNAAIGRVLRMAVYGAAAPAAPMTVEGEAAARISGEEALQQSNKPRQANGKVGFIGMGLFEV